MEKEYTARELKRLGVPEYTIKDLFYRKDWKNKGVYMKVVEVTEKKNVKVINQETFNKKIKPLLERKKKSL